MKLTANISKMKTFLGLGTEVPKHGFHSFSFYHEDASRVLRKLSILRNFAQHMLHRNVLRFCVSLTLLTDKVATTLTAVAVNTYIIDIQCAMLVARPR